MKGNNLQIETEGKKRFIAIKHKNDFLGVGRVQGTFIKNYVPKERRIR
jgi:NOL1/NOP2/fmu family ribosome biogenesis protein